MKPLKYDEFLEKITLIIDNQEKKNIWITDYFKENEINCKFQHLKSGDYAYILDSYDKPENIIIERKNSLTELSQNLKPGKSNRDRFYKEFIRVDNYEKYLLIENDNIDNLISGLYYSDFGINSYIANLLLLQLRYNVRIHFINKYNMAKWILKIFYYHYYNKLKVRENEKEKL